MIKSILTVALAATIAAAFLPSGRAEAKMSCGNVSKRFQVCGEVKPWTRFVVGVGVRSTKPKPTLASK